MFSTQQYSAFDPRALPGCVIWLDAADRNTLSLSGSNVSTWTSKGTLSLTATSVGGGSIQYSNYNNYPSLYFNGTNTKMTTGSISSYGQTGTTWLTVSVNLTPVVSNSTPVDASVVFATLYGTSPEKSIRYNYPPQLVTYTVNNGTTRGGRTNNSNGIRGLIDSSPSMYAFANGVDFTETQTNATFQEGVNQSFQLGQWNTGWLLGHIQEVIVYNTALSIQQYQFVEGYLGWKWGFQSVLPNTHPYKQSFTTMRVFQPIDVSGCFLWLDGADATAVGVSGTNVTAWNDKSGSGNNLTTISATPPTYSRTTGAITFTSQNQTAIRGALNTTYTNPLSTFVVCSITSNTNATFNPRLLVFGTNGTSSTILAGQLNCIVNGNTGSTPGFITVANTGTNPTTQGTNIQTYIPTTFTTVGLFENLSIYSGTALNNNTFLNGNTSTFSSVSTIWSASSPYVTSAGFVALGNYTDGSAVAGDCFSGDIYEVLAYSRSLTVYERQQIEGYLASKWRLSSLLPTSQPFYLLRSLPNTPLFTPSSISGLSLWLDAADPAAFTFSGNAITTWKDKSGNGFDFTANSNGLTYTSNGVLFVDNNFMSNASITTFQGQNTLFLVLRATGINASGIGMIFSYGSDATLDAYGYRILAPGIGTSTSYSWDVNPPGNGNNLDNAGAATLYINGVTGTSNTYSISNQAVLSAPGDGGIGPMGGLVRTGLTLSRSFSSRFYNGYNYEVILYNFKMSTEQRRQVEGYLAWKWGVQTAFQTTHPYYKFRA